MTDHKHANITLGPMTVADSDLPWCRALRGTRCKGRLTPGETRNYHGRCELTRDHTGPHALERGMEIVRFSDD